MFSTIGWRFQLKLKELVISFTDLDAPTMPMGVFSFSIL
jgi:hypothetical protein